MRIAARRDWAPGLWSIELDGTLEAFRPGQFVNVGLPTEDQAMLSRSYSLASPGVARPELFLVQVADGALTPRLHALDEGASVWVTPKGSGFFTLDWIPEARELWMIATGTGLAPYLSMLRDGAVFERFERVILVHGVRHHRDLAYRDEVARLEDAHPVTYVPAVTRDEPGDGILAGRLPKLLASGALEIAADAPIDGDRSHLMLCGNPGMITGAADVLGERGLRKHRQRKPGHFTFEKYW